MPGKGMPLLPRIALVVDTRPEAIKLVPLARALQKDGRVALQWISAGEVGRILADKASPIVVLALTDTLSRMLDADPPAPLLPAPNCPWGDGNAAPRIAAVLGDALAPSQVLRRHG
jgi:hypothetical protein